MAGGGKTDGDFPIWHKVVGISLALSSALLIGASFVLKKRGLLDSNLKENKKPGEGHGYLKNPLWWTGLILMLVGELCNVAAYAFSPAILVTPLGAVSVVISAIMSDIFLKEKLNFSAKIGCAQCILGAILLVVNAPASNSTTTIQSFWNFALDPIFIVYFIVNCLGLAYLILFAAPRWGDRWPLIYISICSIMGSFVVVAMQGFGSAVVYSFANPSVNQFKEWTMYPLLIFVILTGVFQINYLNKALNIFSTAIVTPIYYVFFTTATLLCSAILLRDFRFDTAINGVSALVGFIVIVGGVALLFAYSLQTAKAAKDMNLQKRSSSLRYGTNTSRHSLYQDASSPDLLAGTRRRDGPVSQPGSPLNGADHRHHPQPWSPSHLEVGDPITPHSALTARGGTSGSPTSHHMSASATRPIQGLYDRDPDVPLNLIDSDPDSSDRSLSPGLYPEHPANRLTIDTPPGGYASLVSPNVVDVVLSDEDEEVRRVEMVQAGGGLGSQRRKESASSEALLIGGAAPLGGQEEDR
ncbi:hypothetical protein HDU67_006472 [Dinochytrium kinnereticum]|nr:hypothetical protein HDU67_006472 [Dinochytrium kinnereticum]